ncbi:MAG: DUF5803 family protein [Halodesulfurarchaeum sp.]
MRRVLVVFGLAGMLLLAGCLSGGPIDEQELEASAQYDWETDANATIDASGDSYRAVLSPGNQSEVKLFGPGEFGGEAALPVRAVQFRYANGTVLNASNLTIEEENDRTVVSLPQQGGKLGFTADVQSSQMFVPVAVNGSHTVRLPEGTTVDLPVISRATPADYDIDRSGDRVTLNWEQPDAEMLIVDYYDRRNLLIFGGLAGGLGSVALAGVLYFRAQIAELAKQTGEIDQETDET